MTASLEPVRPITLSEIREARKRIAGTIVRTPLVRLELGPGFPDIRLKLENLQPINAYKLRGAANAVALLSDAERRRGVWTISAGNAGQGVAYAARAAGVPCTVVAIETAPAAKLERMRALGAKLVLVPYAVAWQALEERTYTGVTGTFIHPFDDQNFIAGHATMGLEILEDAPDTVAIIAAIGGGGLITGLASAVKALRSGVKVWGAEPETAAPAALSFAKGSAQVCPGLEGHVCRRRGRQERVSADVAAHAAGRGRLHCGEFGRGEARHASHGGKGARHRRRGGRARARGRAHRQSRSGTGGGHCLRRQYRSGEVLRADWSLTPPTDSSAEWRVSGTRGYFLPPQEVFSSREDAR